MLQLVARISVCCSSAHWHIHVRVTGNRQQAWLPSSALGCLQSRVRMWAEGNNLAEVRTKWSKGAGQHCLVGFFLFPERDSGAGFHIPVATWSHLCFWEGIMADSLSAFFLAAASVSAAVYCVALTPWKMKEGVFLNHVNRWELVCSERCKIDLAAPLRWALSLELSLFILSVRKSLENEPCRHLLIRFLQWDPSCFLPPDGLINDFLSASMKSSPLNNMQAGPQWHLR